MQKEYTISTTGNSQGIAGSIPSGFKVGIKFLCFSDSLEEGKDVKMEVQPCSFIDANPDIEVKNDDMEATYTYHLTQAEYDAVDAINAELLDDFFKPDLEALYPGNVN